MMNKENNKSAAGLRRSAIAERIRLREEWSELKGTPDNLPTNKQASALTKKNLNNNEKRRNNPFIPHKSTKSTSKPTYRTVVQMPGTSEVLRGVVALVDVGAETRALALRAALTALGASVVPAWTPIVTHLVWAQGGCRAIRAKARALASRLVSPLWVEACAASNRRLPEQAFPAAARSSDLPSPRTLRHLLKKAEMENISLLNLLSDDDDKDVKAPRLRLSSDTELDTTADTSLDTSNDRSRDTTADRTQDTKDTSRHASTDKSRDTSSDKSSNKSRDTTKDTSTDIESRVNTAPRRALPLSISPPRPSKSRRKLFTHKEAEEAKTRSSEEESEEESKAAPTRVPKRLATKPTQKDRRDIVRAERLAKRLLAACRAPTRPALHGTEPRIVLTGMGRAERHAVTAAIQQLNGRIQSQVTKSTTHVLLGSCQDDPGITEKTPGKTTCDRRTTGVSQSVISEQNPLKSVNISGVEPCTRDVEPRVVHRSELLKARTLNTLLGAARGCRVLRAQWAVDSAESKKWLHHHGYEVAHLKKISQKARVERTALGRARSEYAYDVFCGMRVRISPRAEQRDAATKLLQLCGAVVQDGDVIQDSGGCDLTIGPGDKEISSKWVFDSVAASRMRTTRRYVNHTLARSLTQINNSDM